MIINWLATKAQQFLPIQDTGFDELSVSFDFALSAEIMGLLYAQNEIDQQIEANEEITVMQNALDEHELALS
ncbi:MAG: hypothetical protein NTY50_15840 [Methylobacter sp.]|nr:hypothetical protein [Methylobacter sp.]